MSRILLITNDFPPIVSGISTVFYNILKHIKDKDFVVIAPMTEGYKSFDLDLPFPVIRHRIPLSEGGFGKILKTLKSCVVLIYYTLRFHIGMIHCGQVLSNGLGGLLCKRLFSIPYVIWVYGSETVRLGRNRLMRALMRSILDGADRVIVNSDFTMDEFLRFGVERRKLFKINPGVDTHLFRPMDRDEGLVERYGLDGKKVILTVSRLDERKGHDMVIRALPEVIEAVPEVVYLIVGRGREERRLRELVSSLGLEDRVVFAGYVPDEELPLYYNICDLFVLPNRITEGSMLRGDYEGFGIVFLEASACCKPVVGGNTGGAGDAVLHERTGLLIDPLSMEEISSAIIELLMNRERAEEMGRLGRERAVREFDWRVLAGLMEECCG